MSTLDAGQLLDELQTLRSEREAASTTTALNLVAFVEDDEHLEALINERIAQLELRNPARSIVLLCDDSRTAVTREHLEVSVKDLTVPQVASLVHDLLVPSVRTVLLWAGSRISEPRFSALGGLADVIIVATSRTADSETQTLADIVALHGGPLEAKLRDLAFLRLTPWQEMVAQFFDDPALAPELSRLEHVEVHSGTSAEAYYFVGWLASRLDWQPCGKDEFCNADGQTVRVSLRKQGLPRRLASVRLSSGGTSFEAAMQEGSDEIVCLRVEGELQRPQRCAPLREVDMVSLIERAIFVPRDQTVYDETVQMVGRLLQHLT